MSDLIARLREYLEGRSIYGRPHALEWLAELERELAELRAQQPVAWRSWGVIEGHSYVTDDAATVAEWQAKGIDVEPLYATKEPKCSG